MKSKKYFPKPLWEPIDPVVLLSGLKAEVKQFNLPNPDTMQEKVRASSQKYADQTRKARMADLRKESFKIDLSGFDYLRSYLPANQATQKSLARADMLTWARSFTMNIDRPKSWHSASNDALREVCDTVTGLMQPLSAAKCPDNNLSSERMHASSKKVPKLYCKVPVFT